MLRSWLSSGRHSELNMAFKRRDPDATAKNGLRDGNGRIYMDVNLQRHACIEKAMQGILSNSLPRLS